MEEKLVERAEVKLRLDKLVIQQGTGGRGESFIGALWRTSATGFSPAHFQRQAEVPIRFCFLSYSGSSHHLSTGKELAVRRSCFLHYSTRLGLSGRHVPFKGWRASLSQLDCCLVIVASQ